MACPKPHQNSQFFVRAPEETCLEQTVTRRLLLCTAVREIQQNCAGALNCACTRGQLRNPRRANFFATSSKEALLRWHPDKFACILVGLAAGEKKIVLEGDDIVARHLSSML